MDIFVYRKQYLKIMEKRQQNEEKISEFPFEIKKLDEELNADLLKNFKGERTEFVEVGPKKWVYPCSYATKATNYYNFQLRPNDVFVATFPRSGTTLTQEMVWLIANDLNYEIAGNIPLVERFPYLELNLIFHSEVVKEFLTENNSDEKKYQMVKDLIVTDWRDVLNKISEKRFIKTHLPFSLLPPDLLKVGSKVVYVARNPKDVAVSYYHLSRLLKAQGFAGDFPKYWDYFERNLVTWGPYWEHIKEGWENRNNENVLFLFYENITKNLQGAIAEISAFLNKTYTNDQIERLEDHLKIENFRQNKSVNFDELEGLGISISGEEKFIRKGKNGGWKDYFDEKLNARADDWIAKSLQNIPGFSFPDITE